MINMGEPDFIQILKVGDSHIFFEKMAEIFFLQTGDTGNLRKSDRLVVMVIGVLQNRLQALEIFDIPLYLSSLDRSGKTVVEQIEHLKHQAVETKQPALGIDFVDNVHLVNDFFEPCKFGLEKRIVRVAVKAEIIGVYIRDIFFQKGVGELQQDCMVAIYGLGGVRNFGVDQKHIVRSKSNGLIVHDNIHLPIYDIHHLDGSMPVGGNKAARIVKYPEKNIKAVCNTVTFKYKIFLLFVCHNKIPPFHKNKITVYKIEKEYHIEKKKAILTYV